MSKPSSYFALTTLQTNCTSTTVASVLLPVTASAFLVSSETNDARIRFDGIDPTPTTGHKIPKDQPPLLILVGSLPGGTLVRALSNAAGTSLIQVTPLQ